MIKRLPEPVVDGLPEMEVRDGGDTWDWECANCGHEHYEVGAVGVGDIATCNHCGVKFMIV